MDRRRLGVAGVAWRGVLVTLAVVIKALRPCEDREVKAAVVSAV